MINVCGSLVGQEELDAVGECFERQWLGCGPKTKEFEEQLAQYLGVAGTVLVNSGSSALHIATKLLDLAPGSEIIVPSFTWPACAQVVVLNGCKPVLCDVERDSQNVSVDTIRSHITENTAAIMAVHYGGKPVDLAPILELGFPVIEDAAHAVASRLNGKALGTIGKIGAFSFGAMKNLAVGEAGAVVSNDLDLLARAKTLRYSGLDQMGASIEYDKGHPWWEHDISEYTLKFLASDLCAAIGCVQLQKLSSLQARRREIWERYQVEFAEIDWFERPLDATATEQHSYFIYSIRLCVGLEEGTRDRLAYFLRDNGIYTTLRYYPLHLSGVFRTDHPLPVCEELNQVSLSLPIHPGLSDDEVLFVVEKVKEFGTKLSVAARPYSAFDS